MALTRREQWLVAGLLAACLMPAVGGLARLVHVWLGTAGPEHARFLAAPTPIVLHVVASLAYASLGAFQFADGLRRRFPAWHRQAGKALVALGLVAALSGVWMTLTYPVFKVEPGPAGFDGLAVFWFRLLSGAGMAAALVLGVDAIRRRDVPAHQAWMLRAYALGMGAGTQVLTHLPFFAFPALQSELGRAVCMGAGWGLNLLLAEWLIARQRRPASVAPRGGRPRPGPA